MKCQLWFLCNYNNYLRIFIILFQVSNRDIKEFLVVNLCLDLNMDFNKIKIQNGYYLHKIYINTLKKKVDSLLDSNTEWYLQLY